MMEIRINKLIVVLGMHRSGTSILTRGLQVMGVGLGDRLIPSAGDNAKGFWEDIDLTALNVEMLRAIDSDWYHLAAIDAIDVEILRKQGYFLRAIELLRQKVGSAPVFGFKDPRVAKLLPFWKEVFNHCQFDVSYLLAVRHPLSVVKSLEKRNGIEVVHSYLLWLGHVISSLTGSTGDKRVLVDYDRLMQSPGRELMRVAKCTGLEVDPTALQSYKSEFLDQGLRHTVYELNDLLLDDTCPPIVREIYAALLDVASEKTNFDDIELQNKVVRWSDEFERLRSPLLLVDKLLVQKVVANQAVAERDEQIVKLNQAVTDCDGHIVYLNQALTDRDDQLASLNQTLTHRDDQLASLNQALTHRDDQLASLNQALTDRDDQLASLNQALTHRDDQLASLNQALTHRDDQLASLNRFVGECDELIAKLNQLVEVLDSQIARLIFSNSFYLTKPLRFLGRVMRGELESAMASFVSIRANNSMSAVVQIKEDIGSLSKRILERKKEFALAELQTVIMQPLKLKCWGIMATQHTLFVAHIIAERLREHGWKVDIMTEIPPDFYHDLYVVICPQMFKKIPTAEKCVVFQMEQSVSSRWFTDAYLETLENSLAVLDYALVNIDFMAGKGIVFPHVYYLPIGASANYGDSIGSSEKTCDILFYGDSKSSPRRCEMLDALRPHFNVRVVNEVFGHEMLEDIKQARLVINLHYYENALLEMPRIQECLSLGVPVVSESAQDQEDYPELVGAVRFFEQGSIPAMLNVVKSALEDTVPPERIAESVTLSAQRFTFMFDRFLVAMGFLPASHVNNMSLPLPNSVDCIALSLPETIGRRRIFETERPAGCVVFDGIRRRPGWVGCGLSYLVLAQYAMKQGKSSLNIMEDDVQLPADFEAKMTVVHDFLDARSGKWDVFAGLIASLHPDAKILSVEVFKDITFVTINKMTSMVFNIYSEKALRLLASWDPENREVESNTIDRFFEGQDDLRIVVALPFLVGHREEVDSTLWGIQNTQYIDMIVNSEQSLKNMVLAQHYSVQNEEAISDIL